jgi:hypothetical protein
MVHTKTELIYGFPRLTCDEIVRPVIHIRKKGSMKNRWALMGAALSLGMAGLAGCNGDGKTDTPAEQGAVNAGNDVKKAANKADNAVADAAKDATAATVVTPKVKNAIVADAELNDKRNLIDVDSKDNVVHLKGHVLTNALKTKAGEIAQKVLKDGNSTDQLSNELKVDKH